MLTYTHTFEYFILKKIIFQKQPKLWGKTNYRNSFKSAKHRAEAILDQFKKVIDETLI